MTIEELKPGEWYKTELESYNSFIFNFRSCTIDEYITVYSDYEVLFNKGDKYRLKKERKIILFSYRIFEKITEEEVNQLKAKIL